MATWKEELGVFNVNGDKIIATDPCYEKDSDSNYVINNCMPGIWRAVAVLTDDTEGWGCRVSYLMVSRENFESFKTKQETVRDIIGVDSGQAGFFDYNFYPVGKREGGGFNDPVSDFDLFYDKCCTATLGKRQADVVELTHHIAFGNPTEGVKGLVVRNDTVQKMGAVSSSGYGDGVYNLTLWKDGVGKVLAARIDFLNKEEEDPYKEDCYFI